MIRNGALAALVCLPLAACGPADAPLKIAHSKVGTGHIVLHSGHDFVPPMKVRILTGAQSPSPAAEFALASAWHRADRDRTDSALELINLPSGWQRVEIEKSGWTGQRQLIAAADHAIPMPAASAPPWEWLLAHPVLSALIVLFAAYLLLAASTGAHFVIEPARGFCMTYLIVFIVTSGHWQWPYFAGYIACLTLLLVFVSMGRILGMSGIVLVTGGLLVLHTIKDYESHAQYVAPGVIHAYVPARSGRDARLLDKSGAELIRFRPTADAGTIVLLGDAVRAARLVMRDPEGKIESVDVRAAQ